MASSIACSGCGQNPCGHLGEELGQPLPLPSSSAAGRAARAVPRSWPGRGELGRRAAAALTGCQGNPSALSSHAEAHSFPRVSLGALTRALIAVFSR